MYHYNLQAYSRMQKIGDKIIKLNEKFEAY